VRRDRLRWLLVVAMFAVLAVKVLAVIGSAPVAAATANEIVLGTTTALQASGLLDVLVPQFEQQAGVHVTTIAVSTGQVLTLGARGEVEVLLVNSPEEERPFMAAGQGVDRRLVLHDDLVFVGPSTDPDRLRAAVDIADALRRIAGGSAYWVSRADNSGPYQLEKKLWQIAGVNPVGQPWYVAVGQGIIPTLLAATERQGYTLADRRTWLEERSSLDLAVVASGFPDLLDLYHVIVVNPNTGPWLNEAGARAFADFLLAPTTQDTIRAFGVERYGQPIFTADGGRVEADLVPAASP
jgi:tungstate transport system substrate-binding protein